MDKKRYSFCLSRALDTLGYSYECIKQRQKSWKHCGECLTADEEENVSDMIAGSKSEGVSRIFESDFDLMVSLDDFICYELIDDIKENDIDKRVKQRVLSATKNYQYEVGMKSSNAESVSDTEISRDSDYTANIQNNIEEARKRLTSIDLKITKSEQNIAVIEKNSIVKYNGIFLLDSENISMGYAVLKVVHLNEQKLLKSYVQENCAFVDAIIELDGTKVISSSRFREFSYKCDEDEFTQTVDGPAGTSLADPYSGSVCDVDSVFCIPCVCKSINQAWVNRKRNYRWPCKELIEEISRLDGHVVPVGNKKSKTSDIEWRICFTKSEVKLIHSFNETQVKLYVLIKMVGKALLKPICSDISSYTLKNVMLWLAEKIPFERYEIENLYGLLRVALKFLRYSIDKRSLPNYMIPERNLFLAKIPTDERENVLKVLDGIINDNTFFITKFQELNFLAQHMVICINEPELAFYMERNRELFEKIFLENWRDVWEFRTPDFLHTCTKQCICLTAMLQICDLLKVSSKTRNCVIEKVFWWITGKMGAVAADDGRTSRSTCWFWNDFGEILPLFMQEENKLNAYRVFIDSREKKKC
ncbi:uncharacterized protein LOC132732716 [Ruditapes philippinarum]|uniref:uncharacterized protein LOC132732716 n=1 Tax=Ruditapes philippinarum TaxID=129788 RepID=UPI00295AE127|nr:uncharacterized protein LOC132732716 [Ruditapes philippinarum]